MRESESGAGNSNFSVETKIAKKFPERKLHADERLDVEIRIEEN